MTTFQKMRKDRKMVKNGMLSGYAWACNNGCGVALFPEQMTQMAHPDGNQIMLVCSDCVHDNFLENWEVQLANDPRL